MLVCVFQVQDWQEQMVFPEAAILIFAWLNVNKKKKKISVYVLKWENEKAPVCMHTHSHMLTVAHSCTPTPVDRQWQISLLIDWTRNHPNKHWFTTSFLISTTAVFSYAIGSRKLSANKLLFFFGAQTVVSLLQTTQIKQGVSFIAANKVYTSANKTTIAWIGTELFFYPGWMRLMFTCVLGR